uniref:Uncharacterized protein n=1 Tax=Arundo donax TaxID=35708 RepID=A0A0A9E5F3_ARUDO
MEAKASKRCPHAEFMEVKARALQVYWGELNAFREQHQRARK